MTIDSRVGRRTLSPLFALTLVTAIGCTGDGDLPVDSEGANGAESTQSSDDASDSSTSGDPQTTSGPQTTGDPQTTGADGSTGSEEDIDPNLDRSEPNILDDPDLCGYPGPGPNGYGGHIEINRFPNFVLEDCSGNQREFAEFFCKRDDDYEDFNHAFIIVFEAVW